MYSDSISEAVVTYHHPQLCLFINRSPFRSEASDRGRWELSACSVSTNHGYAARKGRRDPQYATDRSCRTNGNKANQNLKRGIERKSWQTRRNLHAPFSQTPWWRHVLQPVSVIFEAGGTCFWVYLSSASSSPSPETCFPLAQPSLPIH